MKGRMEGALLTAIGEKTRPWEVKATATVAMAAVQQSPQPGEERMALEFTQRPARVEGAALPGNSKFSTGVSEAPGVSAALPV